MVKIVSNTKMPSIPTQRVELKHRLSAVTASTATKSSLIVSPINLNLGRHRVGKRGANKAQPENAKTFMALWKGNLTHMRTKSPRVSL